MQIETHPIARRARSFPYTTYIGQNIAMLKAYFLYTAYNHTRTFDQS